MAHPPASVDHKFLVQSLPDGLIFGVLGAFALVNDCLGRKYLGGIWNITGVRYFPQTDHVQPSSRAKDDDVAELMHGGYTHALLHESPPDHRHDGIFPRTCSR